MENDQIRKEEAITTTNIDRVEHIEASVLPKKHDSSLQRTSAICNYQCTTLQSNSLTGRRRCALLPAYPTHKYDTRPPLLLLANVPNIDRDLLKKLSFPDNDDNGGGEDDDSNDVENIYKSDRHKQNAEYCPFNFQLNLQHEFLDSFLIDFYQKLYVDTSQRWQISVALLDYNLSRLQKCMNKYSRQVGDAPFTLIDELPMALEFYLQIDVDLFFMKTCDYRDAQPRLIGKERKKEGIFCQQPPSARYGTAECRQSRCFLCEPQRKQGASKIMQFSKQQTHRFLNQYQAILNCPANCFTENVIYALTCPCGEYDYVGSTARSFIERISEHREEGHRIIREFLIGSKNVSDILNEDKRKIEPLANQYDMLLYQHSARCPFSLERFLRKNPHYWCFIPQLSRHVKLDDEAYIASMRKQESRVEQSIPAKLFVDATLLAAAVASTTTTTTTTPATTQKPMRFAAVVADMTRNDEETARLVRQLPDPPNGYGFSTRQRIEQTNFFQTKRDNSVYPSDLIDLYNYAIVAVLPTDCSRDLRNFIEALFITHAETKLNLVGQLTHELSTAISNNCLRSDWCYKLIHPVFQK